MEHVIINAIPPTLPSHAIKSSNLSDQNILYKHLTINFPSSRLNLGFLIKPTYTQKKILSENPGKVSEWLWSCV